MLFQSRYRIRCCLVSILILAMVLPGLGCTNKSLRPYFSWERDHFKGIKLPSRNEILAKAKNNYTKNFPRPLAVVWQTCLNLAIQGGGILGLNADSDEDYRLLFIASKPLNHQPFLDLKFTGVPQLDYVEAWIAVSARRIDDATTQVAVAWVSPTSGRAANPQEEVSGYDLSDQLIEHSKVATLSMKNYLNALELQLFPESQWTQLLSPPTPQLSLRGDPPKKEIAKPKWYKHATRNGNLQSALKRSRNYVIENDSLTKRMEEILKRLKTSANADFDQRFAVYIYASSYSNAYAAPNGDLFITTGLLRELKDVNELAAVLAHEMDHVLQYDAITRFEDYFYWQNLKFNAIMIGLIAGMTVGIVYDPSYWFSIQKPFSSNTEGSFAGLVATAAMIGGMITTAYPSIEIGELAVRDYSMEQELRADRYGTKYLWRAGYPPDSWLKVLKRRSKSESHR
ncbi:M48 family metallopeptidase [Candidatus Nitrospira neomarina]|uniref:M48 family metallopeptidase n=1 Tax=Candidatus Nitrospira neomarina TaxID=3020899 RepID=A0AA96GIF6_9BACT|nr:M48 family metallopeptidase [Candidatus Nitrospira neomarina]WNM61912.1 M48 family metallopeptidase [Candidatus Nitrospira neomarina]